MHYAFNRQKPLNLLYGLSENCKKGRPPIFSDQERAYLNKVSAKDLKGLSRCNSACMEGSLGVQRCKGHIQATGKMNGEETIYLSSGVEGSSGSNKVS